ncbi:Neutral/alkaline non-lysosomal ceramidase [Pirellula sp. SH-Sr6A]|uniref:PVC-type heme-binding CxxCH protein n=1 Tax=Pirellula sp. SH-Sr6A TaxID=1632865 RepID=UPI00078BE2B1|nr:PVC-type heme-binding CxxCH protein [Pirellula sp. SH-Sr6A]AMV32315.1 Neutral/alkaline non-lysosomal ceramidase [Pirellula sp. SH-Sr6A]
MKQTISFSLILGWLCLAMSLRADAQFRAGATAKNIDPKQFPVWVNGGIAGYQADSVRESLYSRTLVLEDGKTAIAIAIVDNCILPHEVTDRAKVLAHQATGIPPERILIAATHTHSAVAVAGTHGCPIQEDYAAALPNWIAEGIQEAQSRLVPARIGFGSTTADRYIYCRDWLMKPGAANSTLFTGRNVDWVSMNPGHENEKKRAPVGSIDRHIPILSVQDQDGNHLALLASFGTHYAGAKALSSDYFGFVCNRLARELRSDAPERFVGLMANGTSGNANCIDFSKPREPFTFTDVGTYVSDLILEAVQEIEYRSDVTIDSEFASFDVAVRMPSAEEVSQAKNWIASHLQDRLPKTMDENYARETVLLSELPATRVMNVQALRVGDMVIAANPCESYGETGLKIRQASPFAHTMNIGLANGHCGYIPPPEMFQLGSYTTWRARTSCLEEFAEPKMVDAIQRLVNQLHGRVRKVALQQRSSEGKMVTLEEQPKPPVAPEMSIGFMQTDGNQKVDLIASEPMVFDPIAMQFDGQGKLWVVEMGDYPHPSPAGHSRVVILSDSNSDGVMDTRSVFQDGLRFATGVQPWANGAFVTVEGKLLFLSDDNHDGRADSQSIWLEGFTAGNPQLRANHPTITPDGWLTIASGLRLGKVQTGKDYPFAKQSVDATGGDIRFHLVTGKLEAIAGPTQYGIAFDLAGRRYGCSNRQPCFVVQVEKVQSSESPLSGFAPAIRNVLAAEAESQVHPLVQAWTTSNLHAGQFTAACGVTLVEGEWMGRGSGIHILACEPTGSLVQCRSLSRRPDGHLEARKDGREDREFLASRDPWFRPVDLVRGPGQSLYVVDMYRAVIEHPEWVPDELKHRPDERDGDGMGRIYRIREQKDAPESPVAVGSDQNLVDLLAHADRWVQRQAVLRILEQIHSSKISETDLDGLRRVTRVEPRTGEQNAAARERVSIAAQLLFAAQSFRPADAIALFRSHDSELQVLGARLVAEVARNTSEESKRDWMAPELIECLREGLHAEQREWSQLSAWSLAWIGLDRLSLETQESIDRGAIAKLIASPEDRLLWMGTSKLLEKEGFAFLLQYLKTLQNAGPTEAEGVSPTELEAIERLAKRMASQTPAGWLGELNALWHSDAKPRSARTEGVALAILSGQLTGGWKGMGLREDAIASIEQVARDSKTLQHRILAIRCLGGLDGVSRLRKEQLYVSCLESEWEGVVLEGIRGLSRLSSPVLTTWVADRVSSVSPSLRNELVSIALRDAAYSESLVQALESKRLSPRLLSPSQLASLQKLPAAELRERAAAVMATLSNESREKVIARYRLAQSEKKGESDFATGQALFGKHCASCHRIDGVGVAIGPDISDSRIQSYEKLLTAVLDPNQTIDANYFRYLARTEDGEVVEGILKEANAQSVVLEQQNGVRRTLSRDELEEFKSSGQSMMPEGFEALITPTEMGELLWYIKNWRYQRDGIPASAILPGRE